MGIVPRPQQIVTAILLILAAAITHPCRAVEEPPGIWQGQMNGDVPATITGGVVVTAEDLARMLRDESPVLIDVLPSPRKPSEQVTPWLPPQHKNIGGSVWIPGAGSGAISPAMETYLRDRFSQLTDGNRERTIVFYCRSECWASWNAAKRAIIMGYRHVHWFPGGVDAWQNLGYPLGAASPEGPAVQ